MPDVYGSWLFDDDPNLKKKFEERLSSFTILAEKAVKDVTTKYPNLSGCTFISYQNLRLALARYFNDVVHFKMFHNIELIHPSKMVAHTIKWIAIYPVLFTNITTENLRELSEDEQFAIININMIFIDETVKYYVSLANPYLSNKLYDAIGSKLSYYLKTGNYDERMASLWFEQLMINN